jgi:hypothetical protein
MPEIGGDFLDFGGVFLALFKVHIQLRSYLEYLDDCTPNHKKIVPQIVPKMLLRVWA